MSDRWHPDFYLTNPLFNPVEPVAKHFCGHTEWPGLEDYNRLLQHSVVDPVSAKQQPLRFVEQGDPPLRWQDQYEPRIYLRGEIQTRLNNWHDFFQVLVWCRFYQTKQAINALHACAQMERLQVTTDTTRSRIENTLTLFDECGAVIISDDPSLLEMISQFSWRSLFIEQRPRFERHVRCLVFGHALYEKALQPYLGMTAHAVLLQVTPEVMTMEEALQTRHVDKLLSGFFLAQERLTTTILQPFPLLGVPGWDVRNENPDYYDNEEYFRSGRRKRGDT